MRSARSLILVVAFLSIAHAAPQPKHKRAKKRNVCKPPSSIAAVANSSPGGELLADPLTTSVEASASSLGAVETLAESASVVISATTTAQPASSQTVEPSESAVSSGAASSGPAFGLETEASSATGVPSTGGVKGKAGIGWAAQEGDAAPAAQFVTPDSTISWWFDWTKNWNQGVLTSDGVNIDAHFIPMLFGVDFLDNDIPFQEGFTELMGYNEPDLKDKNVAVYLEPSVAAEHWKTQIVQIRQQYPEVKVHSPVVASNKTWLSEFFIAICPDNTAADGWGSCAYKPDYVSQHMYTTDLEWFKGQVTNYHKSFGLPVVLSEFACHEWKTTPPQVPVEQVSKFMADTMTWLDQQDFVVKYAWFGSARAAEHMHGVVDSNRLMDESGAITELGKQYMRGGKRA